MIIYKTTNLINGLIYIGQKPMFETEIEFFNSDYYGSGRKIRYAIKEFGEENFKREIIDNADNLEKLNEKEEYWIEYYNATNPEIGYNIAKKSGKYYRLGCKNSEEHRKKISESNKISQKGKTLSSEHKTKISKSHIGIGHTDETKEKLRIINIGREHSQETIKKISIGNTGKSKPQSDEHKNNISKSKTGEKHPYYGKNLPDDHKNNISKAKTGISNYKVLKKYTIQCPNNDIINLIGRDNVMKTLECNTGIFNNKPPYGYKLLYISKLTDEEINILKNK